MVLLEELVQIPGHWLWRF